MVGSIWLRLASRDHKISAVVCRPAENKRPLWCTDRNSPVASRRSFSVSHYGEHDTKRNTNNSSIRSKTLVEPISSSHTRPISGHRHFTIWPGLSRNSQDASSRLGSKSTEEAEKKIEDYLDTLYDDRDVPHDPLQKVRKDGAPEETQRTLQFDDDDDDTGLQRMDRRPRNRSSVDFRSSLAVSAPSINHNEGVDFMEEEEERAERPRTENPELEDFTKRIEDALEQKSSDLLLLAIDASDHKKGLWVDLSNDLFSKSMELLCNDERIQSVIDQHQDMNMTVTSKFMYATPLREIIDGYLDVVLELFHWRRQGRRKLSVDDYANLLFAMYKCGDNEVSERVWGWMQVDGIQPDTRCFNNSLGAHVWCDFDSGRRFKRRITPFYAKARNVPNPGPPWDKIRVGEGGIKSMVISIFGSMLRQQVPADQETICHVLVGMARESALHSVESLIHRTWGIDVEAIADGNDERPPQHDHEPESSMWPKPQLLETIAFCYGINGQFGTGLRLIDHISRHFNVETTSKVWAILLNWSFVLSSKRHKLNSGRGPTMEIGALNQIWVTMRQAPYLVVPSPPMFNMVINMLWTARLETDMIEVMEEARSYIHQRARRRNDARQALTEAQQVRRSHAAELERMDQEIDQLLERIENLISRPGARTNEDSKVAGQMMMQELVRRNDAREALEAAHQAIDLRDGEIGRMYDEWESLIMENKRGTAYLKGWVRKFVASTRYAAWRAMISDDEYVRAEAAEICYVTVPSMFTWPWDIYMPRHVEYYLPTGHVSIERVTDEEILEKQYWRREVYEERLTLLQAWTKMIGRRGMEKPYMTKRMAEDIKNKEQAASAA